MEKIIYKITQIGKENKIHSGVGYVCNDDLFIAQLSAKAKPYVEVYEDAAKYCCKIGDNEYRGAYSKFINYEFTNEYGSKETKEIEINYFIWYKIIVD